MEQVGIVHISDPHFGADPLNKTVGLNPGWRAYDLRLCVQLPQAIKEARITGALADHDPLYVVISGDLTRFGHPTEFCVANTYLLSEWVTGPRGRTRIGLRCPPRELFSVPGNHDHWKGTRWFPPNAYDPVKVRRQFVPTVWTTELLSGAGRLRVELFGVDSNSGFSPGSTNPDADGVLSRTELDVLQGLLDQSVRNAKRSGAVAVRSIICHHTLEERRPELHARPLRPESRKQLLLLAAQFDVRTILTGHKHSFGVIDHLVPLPSSPIVRELRAATTLQTSRGKETDTPRGFWLHRVRLQGHGHRPDWDSWMAVWRANRFEFFTPPFLC